LERDAMCGIAGLIGLGERQVDPEVARRMGKLLVHRGPDGEGLEQPRPHVALAHRRLSIIDIEGGHQPMSNEDGTIWLTFNGEIFNYRELRSELVAKGHRFRTRSDTEVIVHLYEEEGERCVERLNGQFAFALWDGERLFCARDPLGIKPLYYYADARWFAFASEPRAFFAVADLDLELDPEAIALYFRYHYVPAPLSGYRRVRKLHAGEILSLGRDGVPKTRRYWRVPAPEHAPLTDPLAARDWVRSTLEGAIERQLVADVPVGAFLSGGLDSSTVAALAQKTTTDPLHTFTIGFPEKDERQHARELAKHIGSQHVDALFDAQHARQMMGDVLDQSDEPMGDSSFLPTYAVSCLAREHTKVALSGDGGDELFAGYERHARVVQYLHLPPVLRPFWSLIHRSLPAADPGRWAHVDSRTFPTWPARILSEIRDAKAVAIYGPALRARKTCELRDPVREEIERYRDLSPLAQVLAVDVHTSLPDRLLAKVDRASMRTSLEVRVPLLDVEVVKAAFALSPSALLSAGRAKGILRDAVRGTVPDEVLSRKKRGFGSPVKHWFGHELRSMVDERLHSSLAVRDGWIDRRSMAAMLVPRASGDLRGARVWRVLALESWLRNVERMRSVARHHAVSICAIGTNALIEMVPFVASAAGL
jgi:asparagine synthase (glutamine-hydrolysing)